MPHTWAREPTKIICMKEAVESAAVVTTVPALATWVEVLLGWSSMRSCRVFRSVDTCDSNSLKRSDTSRLSDRDTRCEFCMSSFITSF